MIELLTLFLGLYTGTHPVAFNAGGEVAAIEVRLDGQLVATLEGEPWRFDCDFGPELAPHELVAVARAADGRELDSVRQWINLVQPNSAATIAFAYDDRGRPRAVRIAWEAIGQRAPRKIEVFFDGKPLEVEDPEHVPLPAYDEDALHFVSAVIHFTDDLVSYLEAGFGGVYGEQVETELTAVAIELERGARMPPEDELRTWFRKDGAPLRVHGVEKGGSEVILVRDPTVQPHVEQLKDLVAASARRTNQIDGTYLHYYAWLGEGSRLRFVSPGAAPAYVGGVRREMFLHSPAASARDGGFLWHALQQPPMRFPTRFADAVATAGKEAHATHTRRAVVLLLADETDDASFHGYDSVRGYLRRLQVPLRVWSFVSEDPHPVWGEVRYVGARPRARRIPGGFTAAVKDLRDALGAQRIVWLQGRHLPQQIELAPEARGIRFAGR